MNPLKRSRQHREVVDATVLAYVGWRKFAGRDAYRFWSRAGAADAPPALEAHEAALGREERAAKVYPGLCRRVRQLVKTGLADQLAKLSFGPGAWPS
jgi:hypothetical protein